MQLRTAEPPLIGRIVDDRIVLDVRTIQAGTEEELIGVIKRALA